MAAAALLHTAAATVSTPLEADPGITHNGGHTDSAVWTNAASAVLTLPLNAATRPWSPASLLAVRCDGRHVARSVSVSELLPYGSRGQLAQGARAVLQEQLARCVPGLHATWRPAVVRYPPPLGTQEVEVLLVGMGGPARS